MKLELPKLAKVLVIDNYDSFTYNLVQYINELGTETLVIRNDEIPAEELEELVRTQNITHILISPGPGKPKDAKLSNTAISKLGGKLPILGVCLGHQAIGEIFGATVTKAPYLMHGKVSEIHAKTDSPLFKNIPRKFEATRYHSLIIDKESTQDTDLEIIAESSDGLIMGLSHQKIKNLFGVQYHPESILSEYGHKLLENFLELSI